MMRSGRQRVWRRPILVSAGIASAALVVLGCGASGGQSQRAAILASIRSYVIAVDTNDGAAACRLVIPVGQQAAVSKVNALVKSGEFVGVRHADNCVQAFRDLHPGPAKRPGLTADPLAFAQLGKAHITIRGVSATVTQPIVPVVDFGPWVMLLRTHARWLLADLT